MTQIKYFLLAGIFSLTSLALGQDTADTSFQQSRGITDSADKTREANKKGQKLNQTMGAMNLGIAATCFSQCSGGGGGCCSAAPIFLLMGIQNLQQASAQGKTAGQASLTFGQTDIGGGYDPHAANNSKTDPELKKGLDFVASVSNVDPQKTGFTYDPATKTVTAANGKTLKASDVNSAAAMAAAGVSPSVIDTVTKMSEKTLAAAMKKVGKDEKVAVNGEEELSFGGGGGGGADSSSASNSNSEYGSGAGMGAGSGLGIDRDPAQVAGMQKNYNGEPIGVSADSIFKMMSRRYKTKESQNNFLDDAELIQK